MKQDDLEITIHVNGKEIDEETLANLLERKIEQIVTKCIASKVVNIRICNKKNEPVHVTLDITSYIAIILISIASVIATHCILF